MMSDILSKIHWVPHVVFKASHAVVSGSIGSPSLALSEIIPGLYLTCEEGMTHSENVEKDDVCLILNLNGENHVSSYTVYEYKDDVTSFVYNKILSFEDFLSQLDEYTSNEIPENANLKKVFIRSIPAEDSSTYDLSPWFPELCALIELVIVNRKNRESFLATSASNIRRLPSVAAFCLKGVSRSATIVIAYIMKRSCCSLDDAIDIVRCKRPIVNPNTGFLEQLVHWERSGHYRVANFFTASLLACELRNDGGLTRFLENQVPLIICNSKCATEREFFGYVLSKLNLSREDARISYIKVRDSFISYVSNEMYVDVPMFFGNVCEIVTSLSGFSPQVLSCATDLCESFDDEIYFYILKQIVYSGACKEEYDVARTICSFLEAIDTKHFSDEGIKRPRRINGFGKSMHSAPEGLCLSFPCLPFLTLYANGLIQSSDAGVSLDEELSFASEEVLPRVVLETLRKKFLFTAFEIQSDRDDLCVGYCHAYARFGFFNSDLEIKILEGVDRECTLANSAKVYLNLEDPSAFVSLCWVRKIASAAIGTRFFFESIERYFNENHGNRFSEFPTGDLADSFVTWDEVFEVIRSADEAYERKFGSSPDLLAWLRKDLIELSSCGFALIPE